jgi:oxygen-dependent protoporphyrinogen oxidase
VSPGFEPYDVVVAGAGISGLSCAWALRQAGLKVVVLEAADRVGGCITSVRRSGFVADGGPQTFVPTQPFVDVATSVGLASALVRPRAGTPFLFSRGRLLAAPTSPLSFLQTPLLSPLGKLRLLAEPLIGARVAPDDADESLADFAARRAGREVVDAVVKPLIGGIYAGDPKRLSARSTFPALVEAERRYTSVMIGAIAGRKPGAPRRPAPAAFAGGNDGLPNAIAAKLAPNLFLGTRVTKVILRGANVELAYEGAGSGSVVARHAVLALPAWVSAPLLDHLEPDAADALRAIPYASVAQVALAYPRSAVRSDLDGFGFLSGYRSGLRILGASWNSAMFADRSPLESALFTAFMGGVNDPEASKLPDHEIVRVAHADLQRALAIRDAVPTVVAGFTWDRVIPQYDIGHSRRLDAIAAGLSRLRQVSLVGNYFSGPSVPECIARAMSSAEAVGRTLAAKW